jgi:hypothetical protein
MGTYKPYKSKYRVSGKQAASDKEKQADDRYDTTQVALTLFGTF